MLPFSPTHFPHPDPSRPQCFAHLPKSPIPNPQYPIPNIQYPIINADRRPAKTAHPTPIAQQPSETDSGLAVDRENPGQLPDAQIVPTTIYVVRKPGLSVRQIGDAGVKVYAVFVGRTRME
jgi:hypothetical protein